MASWWRGDTFSELQLFGSAVAAPKRSWTGRITYLLFGVLLVYKIVDLVLHRADHGSFFINGLLIAFLGLFAFFKLFYLWMFHSWAVLRSRVRRSQPGQQVFLVERGRTFARAAFSYDPNFQKNLNAALRLNRGPRFYPVPFGPHLYALSVSDTTLTFWTGLRAPLAAFTVPRNELQHINHGQYDFLIGQRDGIQLVITHNARRYRLEIRLRPWWTSRGTQGARLDALHRRPRVDAQPSSPAAPGGRLSAPMTGMPIQTVNAAVGVPSAGMSSGRSYVHPTSPRGQGARAREKAPAGGPPIGQRLRVLGGPVYRRESAYRLKLLL